MPLLLSNNPEKNVEITQSFDNGGQFFTASQFATGMNDVVMMETASGQLWLKGASVSIVSLYATDNAGPVRGPHLQMLHSVNKAVQLPLKYPHFRKTSGAEAFGSSFYPTSGFGESVAAMSYPLIPCNCIINKIDDVGASVTQRGPLPVLSSQALINRDNYFKLDYLNSEGLNVYENFNEPFLIDEGDEIRVSYEVPSNPGTTSKNKQLVTQDFTVEGFYLPAPAVITKAVSIPSVGSSFFFNIETGSNYPYDVDTLYNRFSEMQVSGSIIYFYSDEAGGATNDHASASINSVQLAGSTGLRISVNNYSRPADTGTHRYLLTSTSFLLDSSSYGNAAVSYLTSQFYVGSGSCTSIVSETGTFDNDSFATVDAGYLYDRIKVYPNPVNLDIPIPSGEIKDFTIRKRQNIDNKLVLNMESPSGSRGILTPSPGGFLIPNELTEQQKENVQSIITKLRLRNAFPDEDNGGSRN
tara:strand:- start:2880 stop:4289 length:1410 start_codon:yes stop_codon:yes gene_type:complete